MHEGILAPTVLRGAKGLAEERRETVLEMKCLRSKVEVTRANRVKWCIERLEWKQN